MEFDYCLQHPFVMTCAGPVQSGKSTLINELIRRKDVIIFPNIQRVIFCHNEDEPPYAQELRKQLGSYIQSYNSRKGYRLTWKKAIIFLLWLFGRFHGGSKSLQRSLQHDYTGIIAQKLPVILYCSTASILSQPNSLLHILHFSLRR
jgi:hypothetical protein